MKAVLKSQSGFTLVELIMTATFVASCVVAISSLFYTTGELNRQARNLAIATQLAQQKVESYRNLSYNAIAISPPADDFSGQLPANFGSPKSATATVTEVYASGLKRVDIAIAYTERGVPKKVQVSTYIAARGIDR